VSFVDDILLFLKSVEEHKNHLREVLQTLRKHKVKVKFSKCNFSKEDVKFPRHIVSGKGSIDPSKIKVI